MPAQSIVVTREAAATELSTALAAIRTQLELPEAFPAEVEAEATRAIAGYRLPDDDRTDIPLVTIDPAGSMDLDQALAIEPNGDGWRFFYAIADVPGFVATGGAIDAEARLRGQTLYAADGRIPLHPVSISEGAASLLPDQVRGSYLWQIDLDSAGRPTSTTVTRARVRSRRRWSYDDAHLAVDHEPMFGMLRDLGQARLTLEAERGGASLSTPEILVEPDGNGYRLERRVSLPIESWNAQLSLLTGMEAARMMLDGGIGILRTMPPAEPEAVDRFRRQTVARGTPWPVGESYGDYLRRLSGDDPQHLAIRYAAASLFRGATYRAFDGAPPEQTIQSAIAAPYAHVTAPLRRLVDRFALEVCVALSANVPVPDEVRAALPEIPTAMARSTNLSGRLDRMTLDAVEAAVLAPHLGETFDAVAITGSTLQLLDPAVQTAAPSPQQPGTAVRVRIEATDIAKGTVQVSLVR
ncbi:MAG: RNB domain-containing ribonuclease [Pseudolysinimonas sp.]|uniref:RNB domain-containing ribonuclease n=1 Tax=Pseudolysinimonas sp. TaxID=2680009 RepID=UPI00326530CE